MFSNSSENGERGDAIALFVLGVVIGLTHLPISLQLSAAAVYGFIQVESRLGLLLPVAYAFVGVGAVLANRPGMARVASLPAAGGALLVFWGAVMGGGSLLRATGAFGWVLLLVVGALIAWYLLLGAVIAPLLQRAHGTWGVASGWSWHLAGLCLGYGISGAAITPVGANGIIVAGGISLVAPALVRLPLLVALLVGGHVFGLDNALEQLGDRQAWATHRSEEQMQRAPDRMGEGINPRLSVFHSAPVAFTGWSRLSHVRIQEMRDGWFMASYNSIPQFMQVASDDDDRLESQKDFERDRIYQLVPAGARILISGIGAGRGLESLPGPLHKGIVAVEREPLVGQFFSRQSEGSPLNAVSAIAADGRYVADRSVDRFDAIILETARLTPGAFTVPVTTPFVLYTREAVNTYLSKLDNEGLLIAQFTRIHPSAWREYLPSQFQRSLAEAGVPHAALMSQGKHPNVYLLASHSQVRLDEAVQMMDSVLVPWLPQTLGDVAHGYRLTDDTPFARWATLGEVGQRTILMTVLALLLVCVLCTFLVSGKGGAGPVGAWYFFLIGVGHTVAQLFTFHAYSSFLGDDVLTTLRLIVFFLVYGSIGAWLVTRIDDRLRRPVVTIFFVLGILAVHLAGIDLIPRNAAVTWHRELFMAVTTFPLGLTMGALFPLGLARCPGGFVGRAMLADSFGALAGVAVFFAVLLPLGSVVFFAIGAVAYLGAAMLLPRLSGAAVS